MRSLGTAGLTYKYCWPGCFLKNKERAQLYSRQEVLSLINIIVDDSCSDEESYPAMKKFLKWLTPFFERWLSRHQDIPLSSEQDYLYRQVALIITVAHHVNRHDDEDMASETRALLETAYELTWMVMRTPSSLGTLGKELEQYISHPIESSIDDKFDDIVRNF